MDVELASLVRGLGDPPMPTAVWQAQCDGDDAALKRLAYAQPGESVRMPDLQSYCDDLLRGEELQEGLLRRVLPNALQAWRAQLMKPRSEEFSEALWAGLANRRAFVAQALGPEGVRAAAGFMAVSLLELMAKEETLVQRGKTASSYRWSAEFVSFGCVWDDADMIFGPWRAMERAGYAMCAVQFFSSLVYDGADNPVFGRWKAEDGGGPITPWGTVADFGEGRWSDAAIGSLRERLAGGGLESWLTEAASRLSEHPDRAIAAKVAADATARSKRIESRLGDLARALAAPCLTAAGSWTAETSVRD